MGLDTIFDMYSISRPIMTNTVCAIKIRFVPFTFKLNGLTATKSLEL